MIEKFYTTRQTLGGSSSSNAMLYVRGQQNDYDHWHSLGNPGWSFNDLIPPPPTLEPLNIKNVGRMIFVVLTVLLMLQIQPLNPLLMRTSCNQS
jgi:hypothetical protein